MFNAKKGLVYLFFSLKYYTNFEQIEICVLIYACPVTL